MCLGCLYRYIQRGVLGKRGWVLAIRRMRKRETVADAGILPAWLLPLYLPSYPFSHLSFFSLSFFGAPPFFKIPLSLSPTSPLIFEPPLTVMEKPERQILLEKVSSHIPNFTAQCINQCRRFSPVLISIFFFYFRIHFHHVSESFYYRRTTRTHFIFPGSRKWRKINDEIFTFFFLQHVICFFCPLFIIFLWFTDCLFCVIRKDKRERDIVQIK